MLVLNILVDTEKTCKGFPRRGGSVVCGLWSVVSGQAAMLCDPTVSFIGAANNNYRHLRRALCQKNPKKEKKNHREFY